MLNPTQLLDVRREASLYKEDNSWVDDDDIQGTARTHGYIDDQGNFESSNVFALAIDVLHIVIGRGISDPRASQLRRRIEELHREPSVVPNLSPEGITAAEAQAQVNTHNVDNQAHTAIRNQILTIDQIQSMLILAKVFVDIGTYTTYVNATALTLNKLAEDINAIIGVPSAQGVADGRVLTVNNGQIVWSTIGEAQIAAAVAQYLVDNPIDGVTQVVFDAAVTRLEGLITGLGDRITTNTTNIGTNTSAIATLNTKVSSNTSAIAKNLTDLNTERGRINSIRDIVGLAAGSIGIAPNIIPTAASVVRSYVFAGEDLDVAWLNSKGVNEFEIWMNNTAFHAVDPWTPSADIRVTVAVNETEARAIAIGEAKIIAVRLVFRSNGQFVALRNTWLEIRELPTTDAPTQEQFNKEVAAREAGDQIQPEPITGAARFVSFLADQERSENAAIAHFTVAVAEDYKGVRHTYKVNDYAWFPPGSVDGKVFANIPPPTEQFKLSTDLKVQLLTFHVEPGVIAYPSGGLQAALTTTVKVNIDNPDVLDDDIWVQGSVDGSAVLARVKWTTNTSLLNFVIPQNVAGNIGQNEELDIALQFYDAANAGNLVRQRRIGLPLVKQRAVTKLANRAAYDALAAKDPDTTYYVAKA